MGILTRFGTDRTHLSRGRRGDLGIGHGEKVLAVGVEFETGELLVATTHALYPGVAKQRIRWDQISKAAWVEPMLTATLIDGSGATSGVMTWELKQAADLPAAVHDRVMASVVVTERMELAPGASALLVARQNSDDGEIWWAVVFEAGVDPNDRSLLALADIALNQMRDSLGV